MKIDINDDLKLLEKKIKTYTFVYVSLITILIIVNVLLILFSNYFNQTTMIISSILLNVILIFFIYLFIENFVFRFKRIYKILNQINISEESKITGEIIKVSDPLTYRKNIRIKEVTISCNDRMSVFYDLCDFYGLMGLERLNKTVSIFVKEKFIIGVNDND